MPDHVGHDDKSTSRRLTAPWGSNEKINNEETYLHSWSASVRVCCVSEGRGEGGPRRGVRQQVESDDPAGGADKGCV